MLAKDQPMICYFVASAGLSSFIVDQLEAGVPGVKVFAWEGMTSPLDYHFKRPTYLRRLPGHVRQKILDRPATVLEARSPIDAAWLCEVSLREQGIANYGVVRKNGAENILPWGTFRESDGSTRYDPVEFEVWLETRGKKIVHSTLEGLELKDAFLARGGLKPAMEFFTPYQFQAPAWAETRPAIYASWSTGTGKTLCGFLDSLSRPGDVLCLCPAKARSVWEQQAARYTNLSVYRIVPKHERTKRSWRPLADYLEERRAEAERAFIIAGFDLMADYEDDLSIFTPASLLIDEVHLLSDHKRWTAVPMPDGSCRYDRKLTKASQAARDLARVAEVADGEEFMVSEEDIGPGIDRVTRSVAIMDMTRAKTITFRAGLSATPLNDGRPRGLWAPIDILTCGTLGAYRDFASRYCNATVGYMGSMDDSGESFVPELRARASFFLHEVPYRIAAKYLPPVRFQVHYLEPNEQAEPEAVTAELKRLAKEAVHLGGFEAVGEAAENVRQATIEMRLAEACTRKRPWVVAEVVEALKSGQKVVVLTARRKECERWAKEIQEGWDTYAATRKKALQPVIWWAHGGIPETTRAEMIEAYAIHEGPCVFVANGQAVGTSVDGLQHTDLAILAMLPWSPGDYIQWKGRFCRLEGRSCLIKVVVAAGTYDERVIQILTDKFGPIEQFLEADEIKGDKDMLLGLEDEEKLVKAALVSLKLAKKDKAVLGLDTIGILDSEVDDA